MAKNKNKINVYDDELSILLKIITRSILGVFIIISIFSSIYFVSEQQNGVVTMFGKIVRVDTAGMHFKIPFIQNVKKVDITTHGTGIGYSVDRNGQNIVDNTNGIMITSDFNLLNIDFYMEYKISDPVNYLYSADEPEQVLENVALACIRSVVSNYTVDEAMTTAKGQIQAEVKQNILTELEKYNLGLTVINMTIQDSEPPTTEVMEAFKAVETAKQGADTAKNNALKYQNEQLPEAQAKADRILQEAKATKSARIAEAEGQVARFNSMYEQYKLYPLITKKRMFYETLEDILPSIKVIITDGTTETMYPIESFGNISIDKNEQE